MLRLLIHGVRGSVPSPSPAMAKYGGDTTCFEVDLGTSRRRLLIDCGTGLRHVAVEPDPPGGTAFDVLFSHFHWDHLEGLGFFLPLFQAANRFRFYGHSDRMSVREALEGAMRPPWFPIGLSDTPSAKTFTELSGAPIEIAGVEVVPLALHHPQGVTGYRLNAGGRSVAIATDHEAGDADVDRALIEWAGGVDVLLHDAQYTGEDYEQHRGWGHSTWERAIEVGRAADVGRLVIVSHDPSRTDAQIDALEAMGRVRFPALTAGRAGTTITVEPDRPGGRVHDPTRRTPTA